MSLGPASIRLERRVEWVDTDASGHHHNTFPLKAAEAAEVLLHRRLATPAEVHRAMPRVHASVDYRRRLYLGDLVVVELAVAEVGRTSMTLAFTCTCAGEVAAEGRFVVVHAPHDADGAAPWPDGVRRAFLEAGPQVGERVVDG